LLPGSVPTKKAFRLRKTPSPMQLAPAPGSVFRDGSRHPGKAGTRTTATRTCPGRYAVRYPLAFPSRPGSHPGNESRCGRFDRCGAGPIRGFPPDRNTIVTLFGQPVRPEITLPVLRRKPVGGSGVLQRSGRRRSIEETGDQASLISTATPAARSSFISASTVCGVGCTMSSRRL
jgi:hypothetical protein